MDAANWRVRSTFTIYSRPGCHLCEDAKAQIAPLLKEFLARALTENQYREDAQLRARYRPRRAGDFSWVRGRPPSIASISFNFAAAPNNSVEP